MYHSSWWKRLVTRKNFGLFVYLTKLSKHRVTSQGHVTNDVKCKPTPLPPIHPLSSTKWGLKLNLKELSLMTLFTPRDYITWPRMAYVNMAALLTEPQLNFVIVTWHLCTSRNVCLHRVSGSDVICEQILRLCVPNLNFVLFWPHGIV